MPKRNAVEIANVAHHLVESPWRSVDARILVVATGTCNEKPFEAVLENDASLHATAILYHTNTSPFTSSENQSIRRKLKAAEPSKVTDHRNAPAPDGFESFAHLLYESLSAKHYGQKIALNVPFAEKDQAAALGAEWDGATRQWYVMDKKVDVNAFARWAIT